MTEILDYEGPIPMIGRWAQELLGYHFTVVHRSNRIMVDVDALSRRYGPLIATHCTIAGILYRRDKDQRPSAYDKATFSSSQSSKLKSQTMPVTVTPILSSKILNSSYTQSEEGDLKEKNISSISTSPILFFLC